MFFSKTSRQERHQNEDYDDVFETPPQTPSRSAASWKEAHHAVCVEQATLVVSMTQVIQSGFVDIANAPREDEALLWGQPTHAQRQLAHRLQHDSTSGSSIGQSETDMPVTTPPRQSQQPTKQSSSMFSQAFSMAGQVGGMVNRGFDILTSPLAGERTDYDDNDNDGSMDEIDSGIDLDNAPGTQQQASSSIEHEPQTPRAAIVGEEEAILNTELTMECLVFLQRTIQMCPPRVLTIHAMNLHSSSSNRVKNHEDELYHASEYGSVPEWIEDITQGDDFATAQLLAALPPDQIGFLMDVLAEAKVIQKLTRPGKATLILFPDQNHNSNDVRVAIFDLDMAARNLQQRAHTLEAQAHTAARSAVKCKRANQHKAALYQVQRKRQLEAEVENIYKILGNLESQKLTLENAENQQRIMEAMRATRDTLQQLKVARQAEEAPANTMSAIQSEMEEAETEQAEFMTAMTGVHNEVGDDDELLRELEEMQKEDEQAKAPGNDEDVDELLEELELLSVSQPSQRKVKNSPTMAASIFGESTSGHTESPTNLPKAPSPRRGLFGRKNKNNKEQPSSSTKVSSQEKESEAKPKKSEPKLAVCL